MASDSHGLLSQASELHFSNDIEMKSLETAQFGDAETAQLVPICHDLVSPGVNSSTYHEPYHLCRFRSEVYFSVRYLELCVKPDCHYGYAKSRGGGRTFRSAPHRQRNRTHHVSFLGPDEPGADPPLSRRPSHITMGSRRCLIR